MSEEPSTDDVGRLSPETRRAVKLAAQRAAESAVKRTLLTLGIDASSGRAIREAQLDFSFLRRTRRFTEHRNAKLVVVALSTLVSVAGALIASIFKGP